MSLTTPDCPAARYSNLSITQTGSIVFTATEYATASTASVAFTFTFPTSCINGLTCDQFAISVAGSPGYESASCSGSTTCVCRLVTTPSASSESGTYTRSGTTLIVTPTGGSPETVNYCVQGDRLHFLTIDATTLRTIADQTAQRQ